ncbi:hypothetical protein [Paenibacillus alvei]|uniref:hypothetical protein n=1 Tax=Paenibacillus alvei TaxID=44250 RepID=UPI00228299F1|nr:hypothetical protein [Paenibacillus alvei]MCY7485834.1 hypothetical protein [Paenibacillus alvei]
MTTVEAIAQRMRENYKDKPISLMAYTLGLINGIIVDSEEGKESETIEMIKEIYDAYHIVTSEFPSESDKILN